MDGVAAQQLSSEVSGHVADESWHHGTFRCPAKNLKYSTMSPKIVEKMKLKITQ